MCYLHFCGTSPLMNKSWKPWWIRHATPRQTKLEARCQRLHLQVPTHLPRGWRAEVILNWFVEDYKDSMGYPAFLLLWNRPALDGCQSRFRAWKKNTCLKSWSLLSSIIGFGECFVPCSGFTYHESERRFKSHQADGFPVSQSEPSHYGFKMRSAMVCGWKFSRSPAQNWPHLQLSTTTLWA